MKITTLLSPRMKEIYTKYIMGKTVRQICGEMGLTRAYVYQTIHKAKFRIEGKYKYFKEYSR